MTAEMWAHAMALQGRHGKIDFTLLRRGDQLAYFFLRRAFLPMRPLRAVSALSIANSSSLRPCLISAASHRGRAPRPAQVSPPGPRYLGATLRPFSAEPRPNTVREIPGAWPLSALSRESCFSSSLRF